MHHDQDPARNPALRLFRWYISPMHDKATLHRLWFHGANAVLATGICAIMMTLFALTLFFLPLCGTGLIFAYAACLVSRHLAVMDSRVHSYFFASSQRSKFGLFIPKSHEPTALGALKEYVTDPHMLEVMLYFCFVKLPTAFVLSGITMVIFSGVTSILLSPLVFWLDPDYFRDDLYCVFGSKEYAADGSVECGGWSLNSFGETFLAFLAFIPTLPLTLHLSNFTAKLLGRITLNFLSMSNSSSNVRSVSGQAEMQGKQVYGHMGNGPTARAIQQNAYG